MELVGVVIAVGFVRRRGGGGGGPGERAVLTVRCNSGSSITWHVPEAKNARSSCR